MPVRSTKLLTGAAALVGLCLSSVGCHTMGVHDCGCSGPAAVQASGPVGGYHPAESIPTPPPVIGYQPAVPAAAPGAVASLQKPVRRPLFGPGAEPVAQAPKVTTALKPVPAGAVSGIQNSTWSPVQRVSAEATPVPAGAGPLRIVSMDRPMPITAVPVTTGVEPAEVPLPMAPVIDAPPIKSDKPLDGPKGDKNGKKKNGKDVLPTPKKQPGYPELPPVGITHPIEAPREFSKRSLSAYIIEPPDVLQIDAPADLLVADKSVVLGGPALVRPDGTIGLGTLGSVFVAGMTLDQAKERIARVIQTQRPNDELDVIMRKIKVDVAAYNSKFYYVISDGAGYGEQVIKVPIYGNETVLDAVASIQGLPAVASKKRIWLARATPHGYGSPHILPIDWCGVAMRGSAATNYQMFPGDRLYIQSDRLLNFNSALGKVLSPIERILGVTLLGSSVVNSISGRGMNNNQ